MSGMISGSGAVIRVDFHQKYCELKDFHPANEGYPNFGYLNTRELTESGLLSHRRLWWSCSQRGRRTQLTSSEEGGLSQGPRPPRPRPGAASASAASPR